MASAYEDARSDDLEWLNPYMNMHPTLIPKMKPLTLQKKPKYTGQRPEKFIIPKEVSSVKDQSRIQRNYNFSSGGHSRDKIFEKYRDDNNENYATNQSKSITKTYVDQSTFADSEKLSGTAGTGAATAFGGFSVHGGTADGTTSLGGGNE